MEQILLAYELPNFAHQMETDFFDIVAGVLQGDSLAPYPSIICQDYELWTSIDLMKENGFTLKKKKLYEDDNPQKLLRTKTTPMT